MPNALVRTSIATIVMTSALYLSRNSPVRRIILFLSMHFGHSFRSSSMYRLPHFGQNISSRRFPFFSSGVIFPSFFSSSMNLAQVKKSPLYVFERFARSTYLPSLSLAVNLAEEICSSTLNSDGPASSNTSRERSSNLRTVFFCEPFFMVTEPERTIISVSVQSR